VAATSDAFLGGFARIRSSAIRMKLDVGEYENIKFEKISDINAESGLGKYRLEATIASSEMNVYLNEYKDEMKRRKVVFPGFRAGKLPPYVMGDVRRYLVSYGLENTIGQLCNFNGLMICGEDGSEVAFGEDDLYKEIILNNSHGQDFETQRDVWREGTNFSFISEFCAKSEDEARKEESTVDVVDAVDVKIDQE